MGSSLLEVHLQMSLAVLFLHRKTSKHLVTNKNHIAESFWERIRLTPLVFKRTTVEIACFCNVDSE